MALLGGLAWAAGLAARIAAQIQASRNPPGRVASAGAARRAWPVILFCLAVTIGLMGLLLA
jgi:hypothetical protein